MLLWVLVLLVVLWIWTCTRRPSWSPNGPFLLPILGNVLSVDTKRRHLKFQQWAKRFGAIFHCRLGAQDLVVLNDPELIREAFNKPEISARPDTALFSFLLAEAGVAGSSGKHWQKHRRLVLHSFRTLGIGTPKLECLMHTHIKGFMTDTLSKNCGRAIELGSFMSVALFNITWQMVASEEFGLRDGRTQEIMDWLSHCIMWIQTLSPLDIFPWLNYLLPQRVFNRKKAEDKLQEEHKRLLMPYLTQRREDLDGNSKPRDLIDALLQEQAKDPNRVTDRQIFVTIMEVLFSVGDVTAGVLRWAFFFLCEYPDAQQRIQQEIDCMVGRDRLPVLSDAINMPYTEAALLEIQRMVATAPLGLAHATTAPTMLGGFQLPPGIQVIANIYYVHYDKTLFPDPQQFKPERFTDGSGRFRPDRNVIPFSVGHRRCVGEALARDGLFLFVTSLLQNFRFCFPDGFKQPESLEATISRKPFAYKLVPEAR